MHPTCSRPQLQSHPNTNSCAENKKESTPDELEADSKRWRSDVLIGFKLIQNLHFRLPRKVSDPWKLLSLLEVAERVVKNMLSLDIDKAKWVEFFGTFHAARGRS